MKSVQPVTILVALAFVIVSAAGPASAQGARGPKSNTQVAGAKAPKTAGAPRATGSPKATTPKSEGAKRASGGSTATTTADAGTADTVVGGTTGTTTGRTARAEPNAISTRISRSPEHRTRIEAMLPKGTTLEAASAGFRNQGQFIAAVNASKNQGVSFEALKTAMTVDGLSLGQAVRQVQAAPPTTGTGADPAAGAVTTTGA